MSQRVRWQTLLAAVAARRWRDRPLTGVTEDSREVVPGSVFVARRGLSVDGHDYLQAAAAAGAVLAVVEKPCGAALPQCVVPSAADALVRLAAAWYGDPGRGLHLVGVTGTNGKTTVAHLAAAVLTAGGQRAFSLGTLGLWAGGERLRAPFPWTTPPAPLLYRELARMREAGLRAGVLEVSAQALDQHRVEPSHFEVVAVTNVAREHGEYFPDAVGYRQAKQRLLGGEGAEGRGPGWAVLREDLARDPFWQVGRRRRITFGRERGDVHLTGYEPHGLDWASLTLRLAQGGRPETLAVRLRLPGLHNAENALCAAAIGTVLGVEPGAVVRGLEAVDCVPGRMQHVQRQPFRVIVDYAHNPAGLRGILSAVRRAVPGRVVLVMGARGRRDRGKRPEMGAVAAALCDRVVFTSDRPAGEDPEAAAASMLAAARDCGAKAHFVASRLKALAEALDGLSAGDALVVAGKGDEEWEGDGEPLPGVNDVVALEALLRGHRLAPAWPAVPGAQVGS